MAVVMWRAYPGSLFAPNHQLVVRDYLNLWAGGQLAMAGRLDTVFDPHAYPEWLWSIFGHRLDLHGFGYPPPLLFLAIPLACLPLVGGFLVWTVATATFLWGVLRASGMRAGVALAVTLSPAALENALVGQNGALTAAALAGGLLLAPRRPIAAGALLGLLVLKPQLGLLVPVVLIARRNWQALGWAAAFGLALCGAALAVFGWQAWHDYLTVMGPSVRFYIQVPFGLASHYMMVPPFITLRAAGASLAIAYVGQAMFSASCAVLLWRVARRPDVAWQSVVALTLCLVPLVTPYAHSYDLVCVAAGCALLAQDGLTSDTRLGLAPAWIWPGCAYSVGVALCPGLGMACVGAAAWVAWRATGARLWWEPRAVPAGY